MLSKLSIQRREKHKMEKNNCCFSLRGYNKACWIIENECNLKCPFCFHNQFGKEARICTHKQDEYLKIITNLKQKNIKHVILSGGEPLLSADLFQIITLLEQHNFTISICTNAILATPQFCSRLKHTSVKKLTVNLAALCDNNGRIINDSNSSNVITGIRNLTTADFYVALNNILHTSTTKENILQNIEYASQWGAKVISFTVPVCQYCYESYIADYYISDQIVQKLESYIEEIEHDIDPKIRVEFKYPNCNSDSCPANNEIFGIGTDDILSTCLIKQYQTLL